MATNELAANVRHHFSHPGERKLCLSVFDFPAPSFPLHFLSRFLFFGAHSTLFTVHRAISLFSVNISLLRTPSLRLYYAHFPCLSVSVPSRYLSLPPVLPAQYLYAAPLYNSSLIHTLLHPPSPTPSFRSHTINAGKRAQTEVTCAEHIKELWLNKSRNVC